MTRRLIPIALFLLTVAALGAIYVHSEKARADAPAASHPQTTDTKVIAYLLPCNRPLFYMPHH